MASHGTRATSMVRSGCWDMSLQQARPLRSTQHLRPRSPGINSSHSHLALLNSSTPTLFSTRVGHERFRVRPWPASGTDMRRRVRRQGVRDDNGRANLLRNTTLGYGYSIGRRQKLLDEAKGDGFRPGCNSDFSPFQPCLALDGHRGLCMYILRTSWQMAELVSSVQWETRQTIPSPPPHETTAPIHPTPNACMHGLINYSVRSTSTYKQAFSSR